MIALLYAVLAGATDVSDAPPEVPPASPSALDPTTPPPGEGVLWIGHQRTVGVRKVPILGPIETVTNAYMIARVVDDGEKLLLVEQPCRIEIKSEAGVTLTFDPQSIPRIPPPVITFHTDGDELVGPPWPGGWGEFDVDQDGRPGLAVEVKAPMCRGKLELWSRTLSEARAKRVDGGITGTVSVHIDRQIFHANTACLKLVPKKQSEDVSGVFRYLPAPPGTSCATTPIEAFPSIP